MIIVSVTIEVEPGAIEELKGAMSAVETATRAEAGCEDYTFSLELNDPGKVRVTERWANKEALVAHFGAAHMAEFQAAMGENPPKSVKAHFYEAEEIDFRP